MSGGGFRGRGFGPHGARYSSPQQSSRRDDGQRNNTPRGRGNYQRNSYNSSSRRGGNHQQGDNNNWQQNSQQQRYSRWDQQSHPQPWANSRGGGRDQFQSSVRYSYQQQHNSPYQQRNNRPYGRGRGGNAGDSGGSGNSGGGGSGGGGYGYSGPRGRSNFFSPYYSAPFREKNYQHVDKEPEEPSAPLLGSEEERQQKITEAADELKRKLLSNRISSPVEPNWYDDFNLDTPNKDEDQVNVVKAKPELKHGPPELDLTLSDLKDIGRVDFDNTINSTNVSDNNYSQPSAEIDDDIITWNNLSVAPLTDVDQQQTIGDVDSSTDADVVVVDTNDQVSGTIVDSFEEFQLDNFEIATIKVRDPLTFEESTTTGLSDTPFTTDTATFDLTNVADTYNRDDDSFNNVTDNNKLIANDNNEIAPDKSQVTGELYDLQHYTVQTSSTQSSEQNLFTTDNTSENSIKTTEDKSKSQSKSKSKKSRKQDNSETNTTSSSLLQSPSQSSDYSTQKDDKLDEPTNTSTNFTITDNKIDLNKQIKPQIKIKSTEVLSNKQQTTRTSAFSASENEEFHLPAAFDPRRSGNLSLSTMVPEYDPQLPPPIITNTDNISQCTPYNTHMSSMPMMAPGTAINMPTTMTGYPAHTSYTSMVPYATPIPISYPSVIPPPVEYPQLPLSQVPLPPIPSTKTIANQSSNKPDVNGDTNVSVDDLLGDMQRAMEFAEQCLGSNSNDAIEFPTLPNLPVLPPLPETTAPDVVKKKKKNKKKRPKFEVSKDYGPEQDPASNKETVITAFEPVIIKTEPLAAATPTIKTTVTAVTTEKISVTSSKSSVTTAATTTTTAKTCDNKTTEEDVTDELGRRKVVFNLNTKFKKINKTDDWVGSEPVEDDTKAKLKRLKNLLQLDSDIIITAPTVTTTTTVANDSTGGTFKSQQSYRNNDNTNNGSEKSVTEFTNERDYKKSRDRIRDKSDRRESRKIIEKSDISQDKNNKHSSKKSISDHNNKTSINSNQSYTSKSDKVNNHSDHHNTHNEVSESKTRRSLSSSPHPSLSSWKNRVITRFLRMSKNDIQNMINNSSLRKFDIAMQNLVKEKKSSLSLEMRLNEDEKMKNSTYENEDFMSQLQAILDPAATIDITNLPTTFIHQLSEVLHLDPLPPDNDDLTCDKASLRLALNLDNPSTSTSEIDHIETGGGNGSATANESSRCTGSTNTPAHVTHVTTTHDNTPKHRKIDSRVSKDTTKNSVTPTNPTLYTIRTRGKRTDVDITQNIQQHPTSNASVHTCTSSTSTSSPATTSKSGSTLTSTPSALPPPPAIAAAAPITTIITTAPIPATKVTSHHAGNFNMNDLDDIFSAGIARAKTVKSQATVSTQALTVKPVAIESSASVERVTAIVEKQPLLRRIETPIVERVERQAVELDKIFTAGIAKAKAASLKAAASAASAASMGDEIHDTREYRTQRDSSRESSSNSGGMWKRKVIIDDPDNFRNLTKEEYEAKYGEPPYPSYYEDEYKDFTTMRSRRLVLNGRESIPPSHPVDNSYFTFSPQLANSQNISNPDESDGDDNSLAGSESSSWSSTSSANEDNVELDVSKVLKFIKEREKIAKKKSINDEIRDEVNAEIEKKRREKSARHKSHKSRSKKRDKRKKDKRGKKKKPKKKRRRRSHHSSPINDNPDERPLWLLREDEIKKEPKDDDLVTKEPEFTRVDNRSIKLTATTPAITKTVTSVTTPTSVSKNLRTPSTLSASIPTTITNKNVQSSSTSATKNIQTSSICTAITRTSTSTSTPIATSTTKSNPTSVSTPAVVASSSTNLNSVATKPTISNVIKAALTTSTTATATSPLRIVTTSCTSSNTSSAQSPVTLTKTKAQLKQMPEILPPNNKLSASIDQSPVQSISNNTEASLLNSTDLQTLSPASSSSSVSSNNNNNSMTTTIGNSKPRKLDIKAYKERALQRKLKEQETMRRVAENPSQLTQDLLNLPTKKKSVVKENKQKINPQTTIVITPEVNDNQPIKITCSTSLTDIVNEESLNLQVDNKKCKILSSQPIKQSQQSVTTTTEKPTADTSKPPSVTTAPRKLKRKTPLITDNPVYKEPVVAEEVSKFVNIKSEGGKELKLKEKVKNRPQKSVTTDTPEVVAKKISPATRKKRKSSTNLATVIPEKIADESIKNNNLSESPSKILQSSAPVPVSAATPTPITVAIKAVESDAVESSKSDSNTDPISQKQPAQSTKIPTETNTTNKRKKSLINIETDISNRKQKIESESSEEKQEKNAEAKIDLLNINSVESSELKIINENPMTLFSHYFKPSKNLISDGFPNLVAVEIMEKNIIIQESKPIVSVETSLALDVISVNDNNNLSINTDIINVSEVPSISKSINIESQQPVENMVNLSPLSDKQIEIELSEVNETANKGEILTEKDTSSLDDSKKVQSIDGVISAEVLPKSDQTDGRDGEVNSMLVEEINQREEMLEKIDKPEDPIESDMVKINFDQDQQILTNDLQTNDNVLADLNVDVDVDVNEDEDILKALKNELNVNDLSKTDEIEATQSLPTVTDALTLIDISSSSLLADNPSTIRIQDDENILKSSDSGQTERIPESDASVIDSLGNIGDATTATMSELSEDSLHYDKSFSQSSLPDTEPMSESIDKYDKLQVISSKEGDILVPLTEIKDDKLNEKPTDSWNILDNQDEINEEGLGSIGDTDKSFISDLPLDAPSSPAADNCFKEYSSQSVVLHDQVLTAENLRNSFLDDPLVFSPTKSPIPDEMEFGVLEDTSVMVDPIYDNQLADTSAIDTIEDVPTVEAFVEDEQVANTLALDTLDDPCLSPELSVNFATDQNTAQINIEGSVNPSIADKELIKVIEGTSPERLPSPILQVPPFVEDEPDNINNTNIIVDTVAFDETHDLDNKISDIVNGKSTTNDIITKIDNNETTTSTFVIPDTISTVITSDKYHSVEDNSSAALEATLSSIEAIPSKIEIITSNKDIATVADKSTENIKITQAPIVEQIDPKKLQPQNPSISSLAKEVSVTKHDKDDDKNSSRKSSRSKSSTPTRESKKHRKHHHEQRKKSKITVEKVEEAIAENIVKLVAKPTTKDAVMSRMQEIDITIQELMNEKMRLYQMLQTDKWPVNQPAVASAPGPKSSKLKTQTASKSPRVMVSRLTESKIKQISPEISPVKPDVNISKQESAPTISTPAAVPKTPKSNDKKSKNSDEHATAKLAKKRKHRDDKESTKNKEPRIEVTPEINKKRHHSDGSHRKHKKIESIVTNKSPEETTRKHVKLSQILTRDFKPKVTTKRRSPSPNEIRLSEPSAPTRKSLSISAETNLHKDFKAKADENKSLHEDNKSTTHTDDKIINPTEEPAVKSSSVIGLNDQSLIYSDDSTWDTFDNSTKHERSMGLLLLEESMKREKAAKKNKSIELKKKQSMKKALNVPVISDDEEEIPLAVLMSKKKFQRKKLHQSAGKKSTHEISTKSVSKAGELAKTSGIADDIANKNDSKVEEVSTKVSNFDDISSKTITSTASAVEISNKSSGNIINTDQVSSKVSSSCTAQIHTASTQSKNISSNVDNKISKDHLLEIIDAVAANRTDDDDDDDFTDTTKKNKKESKQKDLENISTDDSVTVDVMTQESTIKLTSATDKNESQAIASEVCNDNVGKVIDSPRPPTNNYDDCEADDSIPDEAEWTTLDSIGFVDDRDEDSYHTTSDVRSIASESDKNKKVDNDSLVAEKELNKDQTTVINNDDDNNDNDDKKLMSNILINKKKKLLQDWEELSNISDKEFDNDHCDINKNDDDNESQVNVKENSTMEAIGGGESLTTEDMIKQKEIDKESSVPKIVVDNDSLPTRFADKVERPKSTVKELLRSKTPIPSERQNSSFGDNHDDDDNDKVEEKEDNVEVGIKRPKSTVKELERPKSTVKELIRSKTPVKNIDVEKSVANKDEKEEKDVQTLNKKCKRVEIRLERPKSTVKELMRSKTPVTNIEQKSSVHDDNDDEKEEEEEEDNDVEDEIMSSKKHKRVEIEERPKSTVKELLRSKTPIPSSDQKSSLRDNNEYEDEIIHEIIVGKKYKKVEIEERPKSTIKELERPKSTVKELLRSKTPSIEKKYLLHDDEDDEEDEINREIISSKKHKKVEIEERPKSTIRELERPKSTVKELLRSKTPMPNSDQKSSFHDDDDDDNNEDDVDREISMSKKYKRVEIEERPKSTFKELLRSKTPIPSIEQKSSSYYNDDDDDDDDVDREIAVSKKLKKVEINERPKSTVKELERPKSTVKELLRSKTPSIDKKYSLYDDESDEDEDNVDREIVMSKKQKRVEIEVERPKSTIKELLRSKTPIASIDDAEEDNDVEDEILLNKIHKRVSLEMERSKSTVKELERPKSTVKELLRSKTPIPSSDQKFSLRDNDNYEGDDGNSDVDREITKVNKKHKKVEIEERPKSTVRELERPKSTVRELLRSKTPIKSLDPQNSLIDDEVDEEEEEEVVQALSKKHKRVEIGVARSKSTVKELERPKSTIKDLSRSKTPMPSIGDQKSALDDEQEDDHFEPVSRKRRKVDKDTERPKSTVRELLRSKTPVKNIDDEKSTAPDTEDDGEQVVKRRGRFSKNKKFSSSRRNSRQSDDSNKTTSSRSKRVGKSPNSRDVSPPLEIDTGVTTTGSTTASKRRPASGGSTSSVSSRKRVTAAASTKTQQQLDANRTARRGRKRKNNKLNNDSVKTRICKVRLVDCKRICLEPESHLSFLQQYGVTKINKRKLSSSSSSSSEQVDSVIEDLPETVRDNDDEDEISPVDNDNLNKSLIIDDEKNLTDDEKLLSDEDKTQSDDDSMELIRVEEIDDNLTSCSNIQDPRGSRLSPMTDFVSSPHEDDELPASDFEVINDDDDDHEISDIEVLEKETPIPENINSQSSPSTSASASASVVPEEKESNSEPRRTQYTVHKGPILDIKVFGDSFLAASEDGAIYRYSQRSNGILNIYKGHEAAVTCLYVHEVPGAAGANNSRWNLFSGSLDATLRCYDIMSGTLNRNVAGVGSPIQCMDEAWGSIFIGTKSGHISRYDIKSGCLREEKLDFSDKPVLALRASTEGVRKVLIVASRNQPITIRDAQNGLFLRTISGQRNHTVYSLLRDRNLVYCGTSNTSIPVFDFISGEQVMQFTAGVGIVCMRLYKQLLFAGCYDGNIYVFDTKEPKLICSIPGPGNMLLSMEIVNDEIIAGSKDRRLHAWQMPDQIRVLVNERT